jgi:Secretion system C-terminal sorting domain
VWLRKIQNKIDMKKFILLFIVCSFQMVIWAQPHSLWKVSQGHKMKSPGLSMNASNKSLMNIMQRLDSVHSVNSDGAGGLVPYTEAYWYDANQVCTGYYSLEWNDVTMMMDSSYKETYLYDANGHIQLLTTWFNNGASFDLFSQDQMTYDASGNVILKMDDLWDNVSMTWLPNQKVSSTYNAQNQLTQELIQFWDANLQQWINNERISYSYGLSGLMIKLTEFFDANLNSWTPMTQRLFAYNASGLLASEEKQDYDLSTISWVTDVLTNYTYNVAGQMEIIEYVQYDVSSQSFSAFEQTNFIYDAAGNNIQQVTIDPNDPLNPYYRQNFVFDNTYAYSDLILPNYLVQEVPEYFTHKLLNLSVESWDGVQWIQESNADLFYSQQTVNEVSEGVVRHDVILYPNPVVSQLTIKTNGVNQPAILVDAQGRCIKRQNISGTEQVDVSNLSNGVYHWIINGKTYTFVK